MSTSATPIYLHYKLHLRSPAIVSTLSGDPSSATTQPFIPGGTIRGALAGRLLAQGVSGDGEEFQHLILSGAVRYLHAYPELAGARSLPISLSWKSRKGEPLQAVDLAAFSGGIDASVDGEDLGDAWSKEALTSVPASFTAATVSGGYRDIASPRIGSRIHVQRDRVKGRPWKDGEEQPHGALFAYEYLEPGQIFHGVVQLMAAGAADLERIKALLEVEPISIGRSRRAGYGGQAEVKFTGSARGEYQNLSDAITGRISSGALFTAFLASAYIGRHAVTGQLDPSALRLELCRRFGGAASVDRTRWAFETIGGFNQKWRMEVPQAQAVAAGSVLVLKAAEDIPAAVLRAIEHEGLGERRAEGFGRVLFLEHHDGTEAISLLHENRPAPESGSSSAMRIASSMQDWLALELLERRIVLAAARAELDRVAVIDLAARTGNRPTSSLIGRLRTLFRRATDEPAAQEALSNLRTWCSDDGDRLALKANARNKLNSCHIRDQETRLLPWLRRLAEAPHGAEGWVALVQASGQQSTLTGLAAKTHLTTRAAAESILHAHSALLRVYLVDAALSTMGRLNRGGER